MDQKVKDTNNRIDKEVSVCCESCYGDRWLIRGTHGLQVANLKTQMEAQKLESIKYLAGGFLVVKCTVPIIAR